jgi:hypothetical protein
MSNGVAARGRFSNGARIERREIRDSMRQMHLWVSLDAQVRPRERAFQGGATSLFGINRRGLRLISRRTM